MRQRVHTRSACVDGRGTRVGAREGARGGFAARISSRGLSHFRPQTKMAPIETLEGQSLSSAACLTFKYCKAAKQTSRSARVVSSLMDWRSRSKSDFSS